MTCRGGGFDAARVMVAAVVTSEVASGVLSNLQGWIAKRKMRKEAAKVRAELAKELRCLRGQHGCAALWRIALGSCEDSEVKGSVEAGGEG